MPLPNPKTLSEAAAMAGVAFLIPRQVAPLIHCSPYAINVAAHDPQARQRLGFPVMITGRRVKIPRIPFLRAMGYEGEIAP